MRKQALKIVPYKNIFDHAWEIEAQTPIYFYEDERPKILIEVPKTIIKQDSQTNYGRLYDKAFSQGPTEKTNKHMLTVDLYHNLSDTRTKINSLFTDGYVLFDVYYNYSEDTSSYYRCILSTHIRKSFAFGHEKAHVFTRLEFYEACSTSTTVFDVENPMGGIVTVEVYVDPNGENIKLNGLHDISNITPISNSFDLNPESIREFVLNDVYLTINDYNELLSPVSSNGYAPFKYAWCTLLSAVTAGDSSLTLSEQGTTNFAAGDKVVISESGNSDIRLIESVDFDKSLSPSNPAVWYQILTFSEALDNSYTEDAVVSINPFYGKDVTVRIRYEDGDYTLKNYTIFKGVIRESFQYMGDQAILRLDNRLNQYVNAIPVISSSPDYGPTYWLDETGAWENSIRWDTQTGSGALANVGVYGGCQIGLWKIEFTSATDFKVTGPNIIEKVGSTASTFYDGTDASDSQINIAPGDWSGTPASGDILLFNTAINFNGRPAIYVASQLLLSYSEFEGIGDETIMDLTSYNTLNSATSSETYNFSFGENVTLGEMVIIAMNHLPGYVYQTAAGTIGLDWLKTTHTRGSVGGENSSLFPLSIGGSIGTSQKFNEFILEYGYNQESGTYLYQYKYPELDSENPSLQIYGKKTSIQLSLPFIFTEANAQKIGKRLYEYFAFGQKNVNTVCKIPKDAVSIGDYTDSASVSFNPAGTYNNIKIIGVTYDLSSMELSFVGIEEKADVLGAWS